ncbi:esterase/lipase family protein [Corynebacterium sp. 335C]
MAAAAATAALTLAAAGQAGATPSGAGEEGSAAGSWSSSGDAGGDAAFPDLGWANDDACIPSSEHPRPVLLVHGTWSEAEEMEPLGRALTDRGYCVWAITYGGGDASLAGAFGSTGVGPVEESARQLHGAIDHVAEGTAAGRAAGEVDLVGHSQGGALIRFALHDHGDAARTGTVVTLAGTNHGTNWMGFGGAGFNRSPVTREIGTRTLGTAPMDQLTDSEATRRLNAMPDTEPGVDYVVFVAAGDMTSYPPEASFLEAGPGATVRNLVVDELCAGDGRVFRHNDVRDDPVMGGLVDDALSGREPVCRA